MFVSQTAVSKVNTKINTRLRSLYKIYIKFKHGLQTSTKCFMHHNFPLTVTSQKVVTCHILLPEIFLFTAAIPLSSHFIVIDGITFLPSSRFVIFGFPSTKMFPCLISGCSLVIILSPTYNHFNSSLTTDLAPVMACWPPQPSLD